VLEEKLTPVSSSAAGDLRLLVVDVLLTPAESGGAPVANPGSVAIVIDVVRATTTLSVMFDRGCARVLVAGDIPEARALVAGTAAPLLLAGESGGLRPPGFDFGNSPVELAEADLAGREVVFCTTNGTKALRACAGARAIMAGSLRNAEAVCRAALRRVGPAAQSPAAGATAVSGVASAETTSEARTEPEGRAAGIVVVCSGRARRPAADDTMCAGVLVEHLERLASEYGYALQLRDGALLAKTVAAGAPSLSDLLRQSAAGQAISKVGLERDLAFCAEVNASQSVPLVCGVTPEGLLVMEQGAE
jgi:2-phosphosulfolactate phosphatase